VRTVPAHVTIYTTPWCSFCRQAKRLLGEKKAAFTEIDVEGRPDLRSFLVSASGQRTVPQVFINGESVGGYSEVAALERRGVLDRLLGAPPPADLPELPT
jgi:glutaredoxin 3